MGGERLSNCLREGWKEQGDEGGLLEGWEGSPKARRNKGLPRRDYTKGIHIVNVRVTDWIALPSCPHLQHCFSHSVFPRKTEGYRAPLSHATNSAPTDIPRPWNLWKLFVNVSVKTKRIMAERYYTEHVLNIARICIIISRHMKFTNINWVSKQVIQVGR